MARKEKKTLANENFADDYAKKLNDLALRKRLILLPNVPKDLGIEQNL
jgi:hypothetical protein